MGFFNEYFFDFLNDKINSEPFIINVFQTKPIQYLCQLCNLN